MMAEHCHAFTQSQGQGHGSKNGGGSLGGSGGQWLCELLSLDHHQLPPPSKRSKKSRRQSSANTSAGAGVNGVLEMIDRDLLLLLAPSVEGPWRPRDFHTDPCPEGTASHRH